MSTVLGAILGVLVLTAAGTMPVLALAGARLVAVPLAPLAGAILAGLSVTTMTLFGGTVAVWFVVDSVLAAVAVAVWWSRAPSFRPWSGAATRPRWVVPGAVVGVGGLAVCAFGLSSLKSPMTGFDAQTIWMLHPVWYLDGHRTTVAALRNPALRFSHPPYPPLVGGSVAVSWLVSGHHTDRIGVVIVALLNGLAIFASATAFVELARTLIGSSGDARRRATILGVGIATALVLMMVAFAISGEYIANGYADVLWSVAAVGAVSYGLVLPLKLPNMGAAFVLVVVAGSTKLEGSVTAACIAGLIAARIYVDSRSDRPTARVRVAVPLAFVGAAWVAIGLWPAVIRYLGALPDLPVGGTRSGTDGTRLHASVSATMSNLHVLTLAVPIAVVGALCLRQARRRAHIGHDAWAWATVMFALVVIEYAYTVGPGSVVAWLDASIYRTTMFPTLEAWWLMGTWGILAASELSWNRDEVPVERRHAAPV